MGRCSIINRLKITEGDVEDYKKLRVLHYRERGIGPYEKIFVIRPTSARGFLGTEVVGVIVYGMPPAELELRSYATGNIFDGLDCSTKLSLVNKNIRTISRLIIEPRFRGIGLSSWLVSDTLRKVCVPIVEGLAVMGEVNKFFERAGMKEYRAGDSVKCLQIIGAFGMAGIEEDELIDPELVERKLNGLGFKEREFINNQMEIFLQRYGRRRMMSAGLERTRYILSKLAHRPVYYIWFNPQMKSLEF